MSGSIARAVSPTRLLRRAGTPLALLVMCCAPFSALAASGLKAVSFHGYRVTVPRAWPVYDLARDPATCVRFNRHAVYLGRPSASQQCPAHAAGRTEAILLEPVSAGAASAGGSSGVAVGSAPGPAGGSSGSLVNRARGIVVTATWNGNGGAIRRALGVRSLSALRASSGTAPPRHAAIDPAARIASASPAVPGGVYTGLGFDACSTPSTSHMSAWGSSSYRAAGVYIGGTNMACSQPNLTAAWVSQESAAGWHLIPIYVGLQAPSNSCGCAAISSSSAAGEGQAAARDAVNKAQALGMGPGNPIYFDMEAYSRGGSNSPAVLTFLAAWTAQLHAEGYLSGVYSSAGSGISDLVSRVGTGYAAPDEIWIARWNGVKSTSDSLVPSGDWSNHQRLHQYQGGHNETHGGVTINIDGDYLNAATAAAGSTADAASEPSASSPPLYWLYTSHGNVYGSRGTPWYGAPWAGGFRGSSIVGMAATGDRKGYWLVNTAGKVFAYGDAAKLTTPRHAHPIRGIVAAPGGGYWLYTAYGNVYGSSGTAWYGSPSANRFRGRSIVGMAATGDGKGYWLVNTAGKAFAYGDAAKLTTPRHAHPIRGIVAAPGGGYWLYTAYGNVYGSSGSAWYGSPSANRFRGRSIVGMAATGDGRGYWLVTAGGSVFAYGDAANPPTPGRGHRITGITGA